MNQKGMTLVEIVVGLGLVVGVSLVSLTVIQTTNKSTQTFDRNNVLLSIERDINSYVLSNRGCSQLITGTNIVPGESFSIRRAESVFNREKGIETSFSGTAQKTIFTEGQEFGNVKISEMIIEEVSSLKTGPSNDSGILTLKLTFQVKSTGEVFDSNTQKLIRRILVPVGLSGQEVISCQLNLASTYEAIKNRICSDLFGGGVTAGMTCAEAVLFVSSKVKENICRDITGLPLDSNGKCPFSSTHSGKSCGGGQYIQGFDNAGNVNCGSTSVPGITPPVACTPSWVPEESTVCKDDAFTQTDGCGGSRVLTGTKETGSCAACVPVWSPEKSSICDGHTFTQTNNCDSLTKIASGTNTAGSCAPPPACTPSWTPIAALTCPSENVAQEDGCGNTRTIKGSKTTGCSGCRSVWRGPAPQGSVRPAELCDDVRSINCFEDVDCGAVCNLPPIRPGHLNNDATCCEQTCSFASQPRYSCGGWRSVSQNIRCQ